MEKKIQSAVQSAVAKLASSGGPLPAVKSKRRRQNARKSGQRLSQIPAAFGRQVTTGVARVNGKQNTGVRLSHREFLCDVDGSGVFNLTTYSLNPGLQRTFRWMAGIASRFESYLFRELVFEYIPAVGTGTAGSVMMAVDFDAADAAPTEKATMMSYQNATRASIWSPCSMSCSAANLAKFGVQRYVRSGAVSIGKDVKTYDVGNLHVATVAPTMSVLGEVYVSYVIDLYTPHAETLDEGAFALLGAAQGVSKQEPFGTVASVPVAGSNIDVVMIHDTIKFKDPGEYLVTIINAGTGLLTSPIANVDSYYSDIASLYGSLVDPNGANCTAGFKVKIGEPDTSMMISFQDIATSVVSTAVRISGYPFQLT